MNNLKILTSVPFCRKVSLMLAGLLLCGSGSVLSQETSLSFQSEPGDYIGQGQSLTLTPADSQFGSQVSDDGRQIGINIFTSPDKGSFWFLNMAAPIGQQLVAGNYEGATRWPFQGPAEPGLSFSGAGRGCNQLTGRFEVLEAVFHPHGYVERFRANFEQHCEGQLPALFGVVNIVNPPPPPALSIELTIDGTAEVVRANGRVTVHGSITCSAPVNVQISGEVSQRASRFVVVRDTFFTNIMCSQTASAWKAETAGASVPFNAGSAEVKVNGTAIDPNYNVPVSAQATSLVRLSNTKKRP